MMHDLLVAGAGSIGERHIRCFLETRRAAVSVCEVDAGLRARIEETYDVRSSYGAFDEALAAAPGLVVIATPAHLHIPMAAQAVQAGCHVLTEKPLSTTLDGIEALCRAAGEGGRLVRVAYVLRHHPAVAAVKEGLLSGAWGRPLHLAVVSGQHFPAFRPAYRDIYYARHETGGGAIQDGLTHFLDIGQWWLGAIDSLVGDAGHVRLEGVEVEDTVNVLARHGNVMAVYHFNQHQFPNESTLTLCCEQATIRVELHANRLLVLPGPGGSWTTRSWPDLQRDDLFVSQANASLDAAEGRAAFTCTLDEAVHTLRCQLALLACLKDGRRENWMTPRDV